MRAIAARPGPRRPSVDARRGCVRSAWAVVACSTLALASAAGCSGDAPTSLRPDFDAGVVAETDASVTTGDGGLLFDAGLVGDASARDAGSSATLFREEFSSRDHIDTATVAELDVNRGLVTLPTITFRPLPTEANLPVVDLTAVDAPVVGESVLVREGITIEARDALDLTARDTVRIVGAVRAGPGGITITAGRAIYVDGPLTSEGPIHLQVAEPDGLVAIGGRIETRGGLRVVTRGRVTLAHEAQVGGSGVFVMAYGTIAVEGAAAHLDGRTDVHLRAEQGLFVRDGAVVRGASVFLESASVALIDAAVHAATRLEVHASERLETARTDLETLDAATAGDVELWARTATLGAATRVSAGDGTRAGSVTVAVSGALRMGEGLSIAGGDGLCTDGGRVSVRAAGEIRAVGLGGELRGGSSIRQGTTCSLRSGGSASVVGWTVRMPPEWVVVGGAGRTDGLATVREDAALTVPLVVLRTRVEGWVVSKPFARRLGGYGFVPELVVARTTTPPGTFVRIQLADADEATPTWVDLDEDVSTRARLANTERLRYRVYLVGRALDAPEIDYFDLRLAP